MSNILDILEKKINSLGLYEGNFPEILEAIAESIPCQTIPYRMKVALAISEIVLFTSQFRVNIRHWNDSLIPINSLFFLIAKSGTSKDSSVKYARKCFSKGYELIQEYRRERAVEAAISLAKENGSESPNSFSEYKSYISLPPPLFAAISTPEGFIAHLNNLSTFPIGSGFIYSGELGQELSTNANMVENLKVLAELYDEGSKEVKILKSKENQSKEVRGIPVSALFVGSQDNILYDDTVKRKFKTEFTSKLARRSCLIFINEESILPAFNNIPDFLANEQKLEDEAKAVREQVIDFIEDLTKDLIRNRPNQLEVSKEVRDLFTLYKRYNEEIADKIDNQYPMAKLTRAHLQWKALKISGAFALLDYSPIIKLEHYKGAIQFLELINRDILFFEQELVKEPYELFVDYCRNYAVDGIFHLSLHNLRKCGFVPTRGQSIQALKELVKLANSYDNKAIYSLKDDTVYYKALEKTENILVSYLPLKGSKGYRKRHCNEGYICIETTFAELEQLLSEDNAYSPFRFKNGHRGIDNIDSTCKWVVLDVDNGEITDNEAHILLSDINHLIARTSNASNPFKFRVLIELDSEVDIPNHKWRQFIYSISQELGIEINVDNLPKSQIFFSYADRNILSVLDATPLPVKEHIQAVEAPERLSETRSTPTGRVAQAMLNDPLTTFSRAFNAPDGQGSRQMIIAAHKARKLGASKKYILNLMNEINRYWVKPLPDHRFESTIIQQIERWKFDP